jgi:hypothetical protein
LGKNHAASCAGQESKLLTSFFFEFLEESLELHGLANCFEERFRAEFLVVLERR